MSSTPRTAVVLYSLGGPDSLEAVRPFLVNLFSDPMILRLPAPVRWALARIIAARRAPVAREIYAKLGGRSPILEETRAQADAVGAALGPGAPFRVFVAMRYWHPFAHETVQEVAEFAPEHIVLVPLYPQFSTTTTASFLRAWEQAAHKVRLQAPVSVLCCYPVEQGFVAALADRARAAIDEAARAGPVRVLFSAHGLPLSVVEAGDPYADQVQRTVAAVLARLALPGLDHVVCFQSRVGRQEWIRPYTDEEVARAGRDGRAVAMVPVAFVSEHSETLVELDIEYRRLAQETGARAYVRAACVGTHPDYIAALAELIVRARDRGPGIMAAEGRRSCGHRFGACPLASA